MATGTEGRPLAELLGSLASDITSLFRKEVDLAKAEASEKVSQIAGAATSLAIGGVLLLGAVGVLLSAIVSLLAAFFVSRGMDPTFASALSAFLVTLVVGIIGWIFISKGVEAVKARSLNMNRTAASLERDAQIVKERL
jgi:uncharacterized membrane protein